MPLLATMLCGLMTMSSLEAPSIASFAFGRKAAFSMEFDDSMDSQIKNALPLLAQYKFQATFYINPGRNNYPAARTVWEKTVPKAGHELGDHTMHHADTVGAEQGAKEIGEAAKVIERVAGHPILTPFGTPGGVKWAIPEDDFQRILKENRLFFPGRQDFFQDGQGDILRFPKLALEKGVWRQLGFHGIGGEWLSTSVENLTTLLRFLDAHRGEMWIAPTGTIWKYQREREAVLDIQRPVNDNGRIILDILFDRAKLEPFELYDVPLTVRVPVPAAWKKAKINVGTRHFQVSVHDAIVQFEASPQENSIVIDRA